MAKLKKPPAVKDVSEQLSVRLPPDLVARIDEHVARLNGAHPGIGFGRAEAMRELLARGLAAVEAEAPRGAGRG